MPRYTMRLTWPDRDSPNDYTFHYNGIEVGRCYLGPIAFNRARWRWFVYQTSINGMEETLAEAQAKFKAAYEASDVFGKPPRRGPLATVDAKP